MPKTKVQKEQLVRDYTDKLAKAKSIVFTDYQGMTMGQLLELRQALAENSAEFTITKNNLLEIALKNSNMTIKDGELAGPTATLFAYGDEISPIKTLVKALKGFQVGKIKSGLLDGGELDSYKIQTLANLPTKDELRAKVVGSLGSPLYGIVSVLQTNLRNLVYALDQVRISKGGE